LVNEISLYYDAQSEKHQIIIRKSAASLEIEIFVPKETITPEQSGH
jgi:hypothetical protein